MKKEVTYYLEDTRRLSEISGEDLQSWINEMPYHQPLRMLAGIKAEQEGQQSNDSEQIYATYFAEDFEPPLSKSKDPKNQKNKSTKKPSTTIDVEDSAVLEVERIIIDEEVGQIKAEVSHDLADDTLEDVVKTELLEESEKLIMVNEVNNKFANEVLEDQLDEELLEVNIDISKDVVISDIIDEKDKVDDDTSVIAEVGYDNFINVDSAIDQEIEAEKKKPKKLKEKKKKGKKKEKKRKESKKVKREEKRKKAQKKKGGKQKEKKKSRSKKNKKSSPKAIAASPKKKKKSDKKPKKSKSGKNKEKIKFVLVDGQKEHSYELDDFDGVSSYTSWLLEQESVNGKSVSKKKKVTSKKKKKSKKKSKVLKIAAESLRKKDSIISEPLAIILATQGHRKKAKKMFEQLSLVFPEKKSHFEEQIKALKKKKNS